MISCNADYWVKLYVVDNWYILPADNVMAVDNRDTFDCWLRNMKLIVDNIYTAYLPVDYLATVNNWYSFAYWLLNDCWKQKYICLLIIQFICTYLIADIVLPANYWMLITEIFWSTDGWMPYTHKNWDNFLSWLVYITHIGYICRSIPPARNSNNTSPPPPHPIPCVAISSIHFPLSSFVLMALTPLSYSTK